MNEIGLPALDGRTPLGFLAALGLTRLLHTYTHDTPALAWSPDDCAARLQTAFETVDEVVTEVTRIVDRIQGGGGLLPGVVAGFPPPGAAPDQLRRTPAELRQLVDQPSPEADAELEGWLSSLVTDLSLDDQGRADISLFTAPSGKQSMFTMLEKPLEFVRRHPESLREGLVGWRRYPGVTGEYLDHRVLYDAADSGAGESQERGVPGATWLALMSFPLFRTTSLGADPISTGWHRRPRRRTLFLYPLWSEPLEPDAIISLLEHPRLPRWHERGLGRSAGVLGIFRICAASRRRIPGRTFAGVLGPELDPA